MNGAKVKRETGKVFHSGQAQRSAKPMQDRLQQQLASGVEIGLAAFTNSSAATIILAVSGMRKSATARCIVQPALPIRLHICI